MQTALLPKDYIRFRLTGDLATDVSDASGVGFFDVKNRTWSYDLLKKLGLSADLFPRVVESDEITGTVSKEASRLTGVPAGTPVMGGGGDSVIQTTGMGLIREGVLGITLGNGGIIAMGMSEFLSTNGGALQFFCNNAKSLYHVMGVMLAAGGSYQWYRNVLCQGEMKDAEALSVDPYALIDEAARKIKARRGKAPLSSLPFRRALPLRRSQSAGRLHRPLTSPTKRATFPGR
jgi:xylulokinase